MIADPLNDIRLAVFAARRLIELGALNPRSMLRILDLIDGHADAIEAAASGVDIVQLPILTLADVAAQADHGPALRVIQGGRP